MSRRQNAGQNHYLLTAKKTFKMWQNSSIWNQQ